MKEQEEVQKKCVDRLKHLYKQADIRKNFMFLHISKDKWRNINLMIDSGRIAPTYCKCDLVVVSYYMRYFLVFIKH